MSRMTTQLEVELLRQDIRRRLVGKESRLDIMRALKLSKSAYYYHLDAIKLEDQERLTEMADGGFVSDMMIAIDTLAVFETMAKAVATTATRDRDKIDAIRLAKEIELDRVTLLAEGPVALAIRKRARRELDDRKNDVPKAT